MKKILLAAALGGLTFFIWGFLSWVVLPWHNATMPNLPNENAVVEVLKSNLPETGVYIFPGYPNMEDATAMDVFTKKHEAGPLGMLFYVHEGKAPMSPSTFFYGYITFFLIALIAAALLSLVVERTKNYAGRVFFITLIGLIIALESHIGGIIWMNVPSAYALVNAVDAIVAWLLAGLVISLIIKPSKDAPVAG